MLGKYSMKRPLPRSPRKAPKWPGSRALLVSVLIGCIIGAFIRMYIHHHTHRRSARKLGKSLAGKCPRVPTLTPVAPALAQCAEREPDLASIIGVSSASIEVQLRYKFRRLPKLQDIPPQSDIFLTFSNGHYSNLMLNAAALITDLGRPIVVLAFDGDTADTCKKYGLPYIWSEVRMDSVDFRQDRCSGIPSICSTFATQVCLALWGTGMLQVAFGWITSKS
jgi:hypothetical protein